MGQPLSALPARVLISGCPGARCSGVQGRAEMFVNVPRPILDTRPVVHRTAAFIVLLLYTTLSLFISRLFKYHETNVYRERGRLGRLIHVQIKVRWYLAVCRSQSPPLFFHLCATRMCRRLWIGSDEGGCAVMSQSHAEHIP